MSTEPVNWGQFTAARTKDPRGIWLDFPVADRRMSLMSVGPQEKGRERPVGADAPSVAPEPSALRYQKYASSLFPLILHWPLWVHRRVETITYIDDRRVRRHVSVDLTIPAWAYSQDFSGPLLIPIALLRKGPLKDFGVVDESGRVLPVLNRNQAQDLAGLLLRSAAEVALRRRSGEKLDQEIAEALWSIVGDEDSSRAEGALDALSRPAGKPSDHQRDFIFEEERVWVIGNNLASNFFLFVVLDDGEVGQRRVLKFEYEQDLRPLPWRDIRSWFGGHFAVEVPNASLCDSYHVEIAAPEDLFIHTGQLQAEDEDENPVDLYGVWRAGSTERLHLHVRGVPLGIDPLLLIRFRIAPFGLLSGALVIGLMSSLYLAGGLLSWRFLGARPDNAAASAVIVALPGVFAAYTFRTGVHRLVRQVVKSVRYVAFGFTLTSFGSAALLAVAWHPGIRYLGWFIATLITLGGTGFAALVGFLNLWRLRFRPVATERRVEA
jgi:hypothetical protein